MNYLNVKFGRTVAVVALLGTIVGLGVVFAQTPPTPTPAPAVETGAVVMKTTVGSFKILSPNDATPAFGKITMSFKGSLLVTSTKETKITIAGDLKQEYNNEKFRKSVYFGKGTATIEGKFSSIQWFGRDLMMTWDGMGICRMYGEFDAKGETGTYTIAGDVLRYWGTGGAMFTLPRFKMPGEAVTAPKVKIGN